MQSYSTDFQRVVPKRISREASSIYPGEEREHRKSPANLSHSSKSVLTRERSPRQRENVSSRAWAALVWKIHPIDRKRDPPFSGFSARFPVESCPGCRGSIGGSIVAPLSRKLIDQRFPAGAEMAESQPPEDGYRRGWRESLSLYLSLSIAEKFRRRRERERFAVVRVCLLYQALMNCRPVNVSQPTTYILSPTDSDQRRREGRARARRIHFLHRSRNWKPGVFSSVGCANTRCCTTDPLVAIPINFWNWDYSHCFFSMSIRGIPTVDTYEVHYCIKYMLSTASVRGDWQWTFRLAVGPAVSRLKNICCNFNGVY